MLFFIIYGNTKSFSKTKGKDHHSIFIKSRNLSDNDKDGRLTSDEFIVAMHCCELARTGQTLPQTLPNEWLVTNVQTTNSNETATYANLNEQLKETINQTNSTDNSLESDAEKKATAQTYEEKRQKNYEVCSLIF